ncbi:MAG: DUF885 domain-containing protein [Gammaproteobacteria bacterium]|nr:DUF885 domain-containing protein [Gammaproteobacteria bacterium]
MMRRTLVLGAWLLVTPVFAAAEPPRPGDVLVGMFEWWNEAYQDPEGFTPEAFARFFDDDAVMVINGNARGPGPVAIARHFRAIQAAVDEVEILLPFREGFDEGARSFTYHYTRAEVDGETRYSRVMGYALVRNGRIALIDFINLPIEGVPPPALGHDRGADAHLLWLLEALFEELLEASPMLAARLDRGVPRGEWDGFSAAARAAEAERLQRWQARLQAEVDRSTLSPRAALQLDVALEELALRLERLDWWAQSYPLNQIVGLHVEIPNLLINHHPISNEADARAYIQRLEGVGPLLREFVADMALREEAGVLMPRAVYPRLIEATRSLLGGAPLEAGEAHPLWRDFQRKLAALELPPAREQALMADAEAALRGEFRAGYGALLARLEDEAARTPVDGGVGQLPDGDAYYRFLLRLFTTTDISPEEVHALGLAEVARIREEMRALMREVGFEGELAEFFTQLREDERFLLPDDDEGREAYLALARELVAGAMARLDEVVTVPPDSDVVVRRFPAYREAGAPGGFYSAPAEDGSRPGIIELNLANMASNPLYALDALIYHEGPPGHHLQIASMLADPAIPQLRKVYVWWLNTAFIEGWALYAELLASEMGLYRDDYAEFGRLSAELWRAVRLVVDSGLHSRGWTREQALDYMADTLPATAEANAREVDRYLAVPGQATAFKIGMQRLLELRAQARQTLGEDFDIRAFHDEILAHGNVPLWAIEQAIAQWLEAQQVAQ